MPYYLFTFDPVAGAAHFDIADREAQQLVSELQSRLPGYLVPKLARKSPAGLLKPCYRLPARRPLQNND
ncbi:hypothetical protein [Aliamphritea spongicola]|nr:hypothetical protein [Aliamphritea spongicola]